jgi:hypothetical protein
MSSSIVAGMVGIAMCSLSAAIADPGLTIDATAMRFIYTPGAGGPGSIGRIDITPNNASMLVVQELTLGTDNAFGGGDDTVVDLAKVGRPGFTAVFSADVYSLGTPNAYAVVGTYTVTDASHAVVVDGDFSSTSAAVAGNTLFMGGSFSNPDGILRPGSPLDSWNFTGDPARTPNIINGVFGGRDGIDGTVSLDRFRDASTMADLFEFQFVGGFPDLDAFFNSGIQASTQADVKVQVVVPVPSATLLGVLGLALVASLRRRLAR